jgi:hypothetical protein
MIRCSTCGHENDEFATVCVQCKGFLQNRIPNLDFYDTVWKVIESPRKAFHDITLAEHKNYSLLMFILFGIGLSFTGFWYFQLGSRYESLLDLLAAGTLFGIPLGLVSAIVFTGFFHIGARLVGGKGGVRNSLAILAYATTPVSLSLILILPIELLTFGMYLFTANPHPYTIKPELYVTLIAVDGIIALWALVLATVGASVSKQISVWRAFLPVIATMCLSLGLLFYAAKLLLRA